MRVVESINTVESDNWSSCQLNLNENFVPE